MQEWRLDLHLLAHEHLVGGHFNPSFFASSLLLPISLPLQNPPSPPRPNDDMGLAVPSPAVPEVAQPDFLPPHAVVPPTAVLPVALATAVLKDKQSGNRMVREQVPQKPILWDLFHDVGAGIHVGAFSRAVECSGTLAEEDEEDDDSRTISCSTTSVVHDARLDRQ
jgi:hypothetical protein